jgi:hypothetical protein
LLFVPCKTKTDIWRLNNGIFDYVAVFVDDLLIAAQDPSSITNSLTDQHQFKLKGTGALQYHLGCDYFKDNTGTLCFGTRKYIKKLIEQYKRMIGQKSKYYPSPLEKADHPEIFTSEELYQA